MFIVVSNKYTFKDLRAQFNTANEMTFLTMFTDVLGNNHKIRHFLVEIFTNVVTIKRIGMKEGFQIIASENNLDVGLRKYFNYK